MQSSEKSLNGTSFVVSYDLSFELFLISLRLFIAEAYVCKNTNSIFKIKTLNIAKNIFFLYLKKSQITKKLINALFLKILGHLSNYSV
jgi:hypothetical protein